MVHSLYGDASAEKPAAGEETVLPGESPSLKALSYFPSTMMPLTARLPRQALACSDIHTTGSERAAVRRTAAASADAAS